jgi:hypothetical protein
VASGLPVESKVGGIGNQEQLAILYQGVGYRATTHPVKCVADDLIDARSFIGGTLEECEELEAEQEKYLQACQEARCDLPLPKAWFMELADFLVMLKIIQQKIAPKFSPEESNFSVDGQFKGDFKSFKEKTSNLTEGNPSRNLELVFIEILSLLKYLDIQLQGELYVSLTNRKLQLNREARFFQIEPGMNEVDIVTKKQHVFKALRLLRNELLDKLGLDTTLQPWITDYFTKEILDWQHSAPALELLRAKIVLFQQKIKDELNHNLLVERQSDQFLEMKMIMAGAKLLANNQQNTYHSISFS